MSRYIGVLLTLGKDSNNNVFDKSVIDKLLKEQPIVPVRINFTGDSIGQTLAFFSDESDVLNVEFETYIPNLDALGVFIVPGGTCSVRDLFTEANGVRRITNYNLTEVSITNNPSDAKLKPFTSPKIKEITDE